LVGLAAGAACNAIIGLDPPEHLSSTSTGAAGNTSSAGASAGGTSTGGAGTSGSTNGGGGAAGSGVGGQAGSGVGGSTTGTPPMLPSLSAASNLKLWLSADYGVDCTSGRVQKWTDLSGSGRDATPQMGQLPPQCGTHSLNNVDVPYFSAPEKDPPFTGETLDVDLGFLQSTSYTIFVVERRWADRTNPTEACLFLGTTVANDDPMCPNAAHMALQMGYVYYDGFPAIGMDVSCLGCRGQIPPVMGPPAPAAFDMIRYTLGGPGEEFWVNGKKIAFNDMDMDGLHAASGGAIGRALLIGVSDLRYIGDIAEVLVFDAPLSDPDRGAMETYLKNHWAQPFAPPP
jgi:hypothetical protein